jgi:hypothetical protein
MHTVSERVDDSALFLVKLGCVKSLVSANCENEREVERTKSAFEVLVPLVFLELA